MYTKIRTPAAIYSSSMDLKQTLSRVLGGQPQYPSKLFQCSAGEATNLNETVRQLMIADNALERRYNKDMPMIDVFDDVHTDQEYRQELNNKSTPSNIGWSIRKMFISHTDTVKHNLSMNVHFTDLFQGVMGFVRQFMKLYEFEDPDILFGKFVEDSKRLQAMTLVISKMIQCIDKVLSVRDRLMRSTRQELLNTLHEMEVSHAEDKRRLVEITAMMDAMNTETTFLTNQTDKDTVRRYLLHSFESRLAAEDLEALHGEWMELAFGCDTENNLLSITRDLNALRDDAVDDTVIREHLGQVKAKLQRFKNTQCSTRELMPETYKCLLQSSGQRGPRNMGVAEFLDSCKPRHDSDDAFKELYDNVEVLYQKAEPACVSTAAPKESDLCLKDRIAPLICAFIRKHNPDSCGLDISLKSLYASIEGDLQRDTSTLAKKRKRVDGLDVIRIVMDRYIAVVSDNQMETFLLFCIIWKSLGH